MRPLRIAFVVTYFPKLSEVFILNQARALERRGHRVEFFALADPGEDRRQPAAEEFVRAGRVVVAGMPKPAAARVRDAARAARGAGLAAARAFDLWRDGVEAASLRNLYRLRAAPGPEFDLIHAQFGEVARQCVFLRRLGRLPTPMVTSFRGNDLSGYLRRARPGVYRQVFAASRACLPVSEGWLDRLAAMGCPRHKLRALPSGVAMAEIARRERNVVTAAPVFISVARLDRHKGIQLGIEAFARAAAALPGARYLVLGDGPERAALARRAAELGVADRVELRGQVTHDRVIAALQTANVHLFTSVRAADGRTEGVPNILKEAHACGVPAVAFAHQGVDEVVADGETGFIVPEGEVAAMAARAVELARAPARLAAMGRAADVRVRERFDLERVTDQLESIYARAIACVE